MCLLKFIGFSCPGCGFLHALWFGLQGRWGESFASFPVWPLVVAFALFFRRSPTAGRFFVALLMGQWLVRAI